MVSIYHIKIIQSTGSDAVFKSAFDNREYPVYNTIASMITDKGKKQKTKFYFMSVPEITNH
jgi:hypothetical protein